jgi:hypothetical protein
MKLLAHLKKDYPNFTFIEGTTFVWSPQDKTITYRSNALTHVAGQWSLLHELSHGILGHSTYRSDIELLKMEAEAWRKATEMAPHYNLTIPDDYAQNCLDTYRDWLHLRSKCPRCSAHSLQTDAHTYKCINCAHYWKVSNSRFCRPYRRSQNKKTPPSHAEKAMFL